MYSLAFYGTLRDPDILQWVAGPSILEAYQGTAWLQDWAAYFIEGERFPVALPVRGSRLEVSLYREVNEDCWQRLRAYEGLDYTWGEWLIEHRAYRYFVGKPTLPLSRKLWTLEEFQQQHKAAYLQEMEWDSRTLSL
jgi:hypothetical protein